MNENQVAAAKLIVFEGMDGSGKSTLSKNVVEQLRWVGERKHFAFPSKDGEVGKLIRKSFTREVTLGDGLLDGTQDRVLGYLMAADGVDREHLVLGHIADGTSVVCDRHPTVSGWVYQRGCMTTDELLAIQQRQWFRRPDITFVLDVPATTAAVRIDVRNEAKNPIFERSDRAYIEKLRQRYMAYAAMHDDVVVLDGMLSPDELLKQTADHLRVWSLVR